MVRCSSEVDRTEVGTPGDRRGACGVASRPVGAGSQGAVSSTRTDVRGDSGHIAVMNIKHNTFDVRPLPEKNLNQLNIY